MKVVVAGGTGFIGNPLVRALEARGDQPIVLTRTVRAPNHRAWDGKTLGEWARDLNGANAVVNLAGSSINQRWDAEGRRSILESRVNSCRVLGEAVRAANDPPKVWVQGSAVGFYGDTGETLVDETSGPGTGFLAETCIAWEEAARAAAEGIPLSLIRTGVVLGRGGGALEPLVKLTRSFLGGAAGSGRQFLPWIHLDDIVGVFLWALDSGWEGPVNGVQPEPVRNADLMAALRKVLRRPWSPPAPAFGIKLVEAMAGVPSELILGSQRVTTTVLPGRYRFRHADLFEALKASV
jgi:uncharacterized protein (TIGR01777 family)